MINIFDEMVMYAGVFHDDIRIRSRTFENVFVFQLFDFKSRRYGGDDLGMWACLLVTVVQKECFQSFSSSGSHEKL